MHRFLKKYGKSVFVNLAITAGLIFLCLLIVIIFIVYTLDRSALNWSPNIKAIQKEFSTYFSSHPWRQYTSSDFHISFQYPYGGWKVTVEKEPNLIFEKNHIRVNWNGSSNLLMRRIARTTTDPHIQMKELIMNDYGTTDGINAEKAQILYLRDDLVYIKDVVKKRNHALIRYIVIQKDHLIPILIDNYGEWSGNGAPQEYTDLIDEGFRRVILTMKSIE